MHTSINPARSEIVLALCLLLKHPATLSDVSTMRCSTRAKRKTKSVVRPQHAGLLSPILFAQESNDSFSVGMHSERKLVCSRVLQSLVDKLYPEFAKKEMREVRVLLSDTRLVPTLQCHAFHKEEEFYKKLNIKRKVTPERAQVRASRNSEPCPRIVCFTALGFLFRVVQPARSSKRRKSVSDCPHHP